MTYKDVIRLAHDEGYTLWTWHYEHYYLQQGVPQEGGASLAVPERTVNTLRRHHLLTAQAKKSPWDFLTVFMIKQA
jgi:hypothetical protein